MGRLIWSYILLNYRVILFTGIIALIGSFLTMFGFVNQHKTLLIIGPIVATSGKLFLISAVLFPQVIKLLIEKVRKGGSIPTVE